MQITQLFLRVSIYPLPANRKHSHVSRMHTALGDQLKLPKRPLTVYRVEADERQAGWERRKLIKQRRQVASVLGWHGGL